MPRQERDAAARHLADEHRLTWLAERSVDLHLVAVGEELVETRTADDSDVRDRSHARQATFSPDEPEDEEEDEEEEEEEEEEESEEEEEEEEEAGAFSPPAELLSSPADEDDFAADEPLRLSFR
jgi:hypothetical protein